jgi:hypothetical protein
VALAEPACFDCWQVARIGHYGATRVRLSGIVVSDSWRRYPGPPRVAAGSRGSIDGLARLRWLGFLTLVPLARLPRGQFRIWLAGRSGSLVCYPEYCPSRLVAVAGDVLARSRYGCMMDGMLHILKFHILGFQIASYTRLDVCFDNVNF